MMISEEFSFIFFFFSLQLFLKSSQFYTRNSSEITAHAVNTRSPSGNSPETSLRIPSNIPGRIFTKCFFPKFLLKLIRIFFFFFFEGSTRCSSEVPAQFFQEFIQEYYFRIASEVSLRFTQRFFVRAPPTFSRSS